jgi:hypothetical protein
VDDLLMKWWWYLVDVDVDASSLPPPPPPCLVSSRSWRWRSSSERECESGETVDDGDGGTLADAVAAATGLAGDGGSVSTGEEDPGVAGASADAAKRRSASPTAASERK